MPKPKYSRDELAPEGFKGVSGDTVPSPSKPQPQPTKPFTPGSGGGNNGR